VNAYQLCLAGRGLGYHCDRAFEAAAAGAAPVLHSPEANTYHDYVHKVNCFLYDPALEPEQIADFVQDILRDPESIPIVAEGARRLLESRHRATVVVDYLYGILTTPIP